MELEELLIDLLDFLQLLRNIYARHTTTGYLLPYHTYLDTHVERNQTQDAFYTSVSIVQRKIIPMDSHDNPVVCSINTMIRTQQDFDVVRQWFETCSLSLGFNLNMMPLNKAMKVRGV